MCIRDSYSEERSGNISKRLREIKQYEKHWGIAFTGYEQETADIKDINYLDFKPSNYCNSKCVMCNNNRSSQYALESKKHKGYTGPILVGDWYNDNKHKIEPLYDNVWRFKLNGGETTVMPEFAPIIEAVAKANSPKSHLILNINNTVDITKYHDYLKQVKRISVVHSIEGWGTVNEYIRYPGKWNIILENIKRMDQYQKENKNVECYFGMTVMSLNYLDFPNTVKQLQSYFPNIGFDVYHLNQPKQLLVQGLTNEQLQLGLRRMEQVYATLDQQIQKDLTHTLKYYKDVASWGSNKTTRQMLKQYVQYIDKARNININNYIPELQLT